MEEEEQPSPMDISPFRRASYFEEEDDSLDIPGISPIAPAPAPASAQQQQKQKKQTNENELRFSPVPLRPDAFGPRRQLVFPAPGRQAQERGRGDRQYFTVRALRGGVEDALVDLAGSGPFVVVKMPVMAELEASKATVTFRPFGSWPRQQEPLQFNVERSVPGWFRGYRAQLARDPDAPFTDGIDNEDRTLFPLNLDMMGWPAGESVFSLVQVPGEGGYNVWTLSASDANRRMRLTVVLIAPRMSVRIFTFDGRTQE